VNYPKWLEYFEAHTVFLHSSSPLFRVIQMAKDGWDLAYLSGTSAALSPGEFCAKYQDTPTEEVPTVELPIPERNP
jgi:hypothetical protein